MRVNFYNISGQFATTGSDLGFSIVGKVDNPVTLLTINGLNLSDLQKIVKICSDKQQAVLYAKDEKVGKISDFVINHIGGKNIPIDDEFNTLSLWADNHVYLPTQDSISNSNVVASGTVTNAIGNAVGKVGSIFGVGK
jgi:hypothetical protein